MKKIIPFKLAVLLFIMLPIVISCSNRAAQIPNLGLGDALINCNTADTDIFIESVKYIPLETNNSCLIADASFVSLYDEFILVADSKHNVFLFDLNGKFIRKIGIKGKGPGEYQTIFGYAFDITSGKIYLASPSDTKVYTIDGKYVQTLNFRFDFESMLVHNDSYIITKPAFQFPDKSARSVIEIYTENGDVIRKIDYRGEIGDIPYFSMLYLKDGYTYYREELSDTLLRFGKDLNPVPFAILGLNDFLVTQGNFKYTNIPEIEKCYRVFKMFDFKDMICFNMQKGFMSFNDITTLFYLKKSKEVVCVGNRNGKGGLFINSVSHIPKAADENRILCLIPYKDISLLKRDSIQNPELLTISGSITENSNPVFSLVTFK